MKTYTLDEARELLTKRAEEYTVAKVKVENLAAVPKSDRSEVDYQVADAERQRAWSLLEKAKAIFTKAEISEEDEW